MNFYTIKNPSDVFSLIMDVYGTLEQSITFVSDNSALFPSLNTDITLLVGQVVNYNPSLVVTYLTPKPVLPTPATPATAYTWRGREGQNMFDVCLQTYGTLENQVKLLNENQLDFNTTVYMQPFNYDSTLIANSSVWNRTTGMGVIFSTGGILPGSSSFDSSFETISFDYSVE